MQPKETLTLSVIVPMRNEEDYIGACLSSLVQQTLPASQYEVVVVDGCSTDGSGRIVADIASRHECVRLIKNHSQDTPSGMNAGIQSTESEIVVIAGAHTIYPRDFLQNCVLWLNKTGAEVVGGPVETVIASETVGARIAALILSSRFGVGNSRFRTSTREGYVDSVPFGAYRRTVFEQVGLFNERLVRNQDNDMSARIRRAGGRIFLTPALSTKYIGASGFGDLISQAFRKSQWHLLTLRENIRSMGVRHLAPAGLVLVLLSLGFASFESHIARYLLASLCLTYVGIGMLLAFDSAAKGPIILRLILPFASFPFHISYGLGTLVGIRRVVDGWNLHRSKSWAAENTESSVCLPKLQEPWEK